MVWPGTHCYMFLVRRMGGLDQVVFYGQWYNIWSTYNITFSFLYALNEGDREERGVCMHFIYIHWYPLPTKQVPLSSLVLFLSGPLLGFFSSSFLPFLFFCLWLLHFDTPKHTRLASLKAGELAIFSFSFSPCFLPLSLAWIMMCALYCWLMVLWGTGREAHLLLTIFCLFPAAG